MRTLDMNLCKILWIGESSFPKAIFISFVFQFDYKRFQRYCLINSICEFQFVTYYLIIRFHCILYMQTVLDNHFTIGERVYKRIEPPVILHRAISRKDGKQYLLKIWELSNAGTHFLNYSQRFDHENFTLREISKENVPCFPTLIQFESSAIFSEKNPQIISYQVFEDVKFDSLIDYHHTKRMIPERTAIAIYKKIIKTVKLLNSLGKTLFTIDPSYILIDKDINPVFMDFSFSRKLNHAEPISTFDDFHITRSFKPP